jgi:hypothetical protein
MDPIQLDQNSSACYFAMSVLLPTALATDGFWELTRFVFQYLESKS